MATIQQAFGTKTAYTMGNTGTLATDAFRSGPAVDNSSDKFLDVLVSVQLANGSGTVGDLKAWRLWVAGTLDSTSEDWTDTIAADTDTVTPTDPPNLIQVSIVHAPAASTTYKAGPVSLAQCFGCLLYTSPSPRDGLLYRMPSYA